MNLTEKQDFQLLGYSQFKIENWFLKSNPVKN